MRPYNNQPPKIEIVDVITLELPLTNVLNSFQRFELSMLILNVHCET